MRIEFVKKIGFSLALGLASFSPLSTFADTSRPNIAYKETRVTASVPAFTQGVDFAQNHSDLLADPNVRFGRLSNGMTYVIMKNATPPGTASIRLRIGAGSMMEREDQRGLAHFLEHMAFNGSKSVPEGDMVKILERHGLAFGADTNAYTEFDTTVYQLDLPKADDETLNVGLFLMRETASNLSLEAGAIDRERGVILGEERLRDQPGLHAYIAFAKTLFAGQKYPERLPIGLTEVIKNAPRQAFVDFYHTWYRPELTTLVVVGDFDIEAMEAKIQKAFGDWTPEPKTPIETPNFGDYSPKGKFAKVYTEKGLGESLSLTWTKPIDLKYQTYDTILNDWRFSLAVNALNERFNKAAHKEGTAFGSAGFSNSDVDQTANTYSLYIDPKPGQEKEAFAQAYEIYRQFLLFGVTQTEVDRAHEEYEAGLKTAVQGENTRRTAGLADSIINTIDDLNVFSSPSQDYALYQALKPQMDLSSVNASIATELNGLDGPFVWFTAEDNKGMSSENMLSIVADIDAKPLAAAEVDAKMAWPYTEFGKASKLVERKEINDLGIVNLRYDNGVRVVIKTTDFKKDQVLVSVNYMGGLKAIAANSKAPILLASQLGVSEGGLGKLDASQIRDSLNGRFYGANLSLDEDSLSLQGSTTHNDFALQMQVLMAFSTDSAYRPDALERLKSYLPDLFTRLYASPSGVFNMFGSKLLHSGDDRFGIPPQEELLATNNDDIKYLINSQLSTGPIEIVVVGDITEAEVRAEIEKTFATLPKRSDTPARPLNADHVTFPEGPQTYVLHHKGREDQALMFIGFKGPDFWSDTKRARGMQILSGILNLRLIDEVREKKAIAYSPSSGFVQSTEFKDYGYVGVSAEVAPENFGAFKDSIHDIALNLSTIPITEDELLRARKPELESLENSYKSNNYWFNAIQGSSRDTRKLDNIRSRKQSLMSVTVSDIMDLAKAYLNMEKAIVIEVIADKPSDVKTGN